jgi:hypothetical protein
MWQSGMVIELFVNNVFIDLIQPKIRQKYNHEVNGKSRSFCAKNCLHA